MCECCLACYLVVRQKVIEALQLIGMHTHDEDSLANLEARCCQAVNSFPAAFAGAVEDVHVKGLKENADVLGHLLSIGLDILDHDD